MKRRGQDAAIVAWDFRTGQMPEWVEADGGELSFEELADGSTALVVPPATALLLPIEGLAGNRGGLKLNDYTISMDILLDELPQRATLYRASPASGSDGEAFVDAAGDVVGTAPASNRDGTALRIEPGKWCRVTVTVARTGFTTYIDGERSNFVTTVKAPDISKKDGRFALDTDTLYLFSSEDPVLQPGAKLRFAELRPRLLDADEVASEAMASKVSGAFLRQQEKEAAAGADKLVLADVYTQPTPMWVHTGFLAHFGDAALEGTALGCGARKARWLPDHCGCAGTGRHER